MENAKTLIWKIIDGKKEIQFFIDGGYDELIFNHDVRLFDIPYRISVSGSNEIKSVLIGKYIKKINESKMIRKKTRVLYPNEDRPLPTAVLMADYEEDLHSFVYGYGDTPDVAVSCMDVMNEIIFGTGDEIFVPHRDGDEWKVDFVDRPSECGDLLYVVSEYIWDGLIYQYKIDGEDCHSHGFEGVLSAVLDAMKEGKEIEFDGFEYNYSEQELRILNKFVNKLRADYKMNESEK